MRPATIRKIAGLIGAVVVLIAPSLPVTPEMRQLLTDVGGLLAYFGHAPDVKSKPCEPPASDEASA